MAVSPSARRKARHYAMQALYQWQMTGAVLRTIEKEFYADYDMSKVDVNYFRELLHGVPKQLEALDKALSPSLQDRTLKELDYITLALLRMGAYELEHRIDVPYKVVINEAVSLSKKFGAEDSHKFVNGVLDQTARQLRALEVKTGH